MQLRRLRIRSTVALVLLCLCARPLCATPSPKPGYMDIVLEGPWIFQYYVYNNVPVLIAMAPAVTGHHGPTFTTGTGGNLPAPNVVYAVSFNDIPFPYPTNTAQQPPVLSSGSYPTLSFIEPLKIKTKWPQIDLSTPAYYFILPMPNYATNEAQDAMKLSSTFGQYSNPPETHTTGLSLHYQLPIGKVVLYQCDHADLCGTPTSVETQPNSGTLKIEFTADIEATPDELKCDNHVRLAYQKMMRFLDPGPSALNASVYYLDLPGQDDNDQYSSICYDIDPQKPTTTQTMHGRGILAIDINAATNDVVKALKAADPEGRGACTEGLGCEKLKNLAEARTGKLTPRFDYVLIEDLRESISKLGAAYNQALKDFQQQRSGSRNLESSMNPLLAKLLNAQSLELRLSDITIYNAQTGKDCKVAQIRLQ